MAVAITIMALGLLDLFYALSPEYSWRRRLLKIFFWILYPILVVVFFSGRQARQDRDTHILHASVIVALGALLMVAALFF